MTIDKLLRQLLDTEERPFGFTNIPVMYTEDGKIFKPVTKAEFRKIGYGVSEEQVIVFTCD